MADVGRYRGRRNRGHSIVSGKLLRPLPYAPIVPQRLPSN
jgi:hypothetical protein